jgi:hypothetical protein
MVVNAWLGVQATGLTRYRDKTASLVDVQTVAVYDPFYPPEIELWAIQMGKYDEWRG